MIRFNHNIPIHHPSQLTLLHSIRFGLAYNFELNILKFFIYEKIKMFYEMPS